MAFTRPWDATFPPDTQQANLLGQDIREDKVDTSERIRAFGAGLIANRETPEAVFGNANIGALFFAEDEGKLYRWNGSAWNRIFIARTFVDAGPATKTASGVDQDMLSLTIPANTLAVGDVLDISFGLLDGSDGGPNHSQKLVVSGTTALQLGYIQHASIQGAGFVSAVARVFDATTLVVSAHGVSVTSAATVSAADVVLPAIVLSSAIEIKTVLGPGNKQFTHRELIVAIK